MQVGMYVCARRWTLLRGALGRIFNLFHGRFYNFVLERLQLRAQESCENNNNDDDGGGDNDGDGGGSGGGGGCGGDG